MLVGKLRRLRRIADQHAEHFRSDGITRLFAMLETELSDEYFALVEQHLKQLQFRKGVLVSGQLGMGNKARNYVLRKPDQDQRNWVARLLQQPLATHSIFILAMIRVHRRWPICRTGASTTSQMRRPSRRIIS